MSRRGCAAPQPRHGTGARPTALQTRCQQQQDPPIAAPLRARPPPAQRLKHATWLRRGGADAPGSPFHELRLQGVGPQLDIKRRNYSRLYDGSSGGGGGSARTATEPGAAAVAGAAAAASHVDWATAFADPRLPLAVDCGCGAGRFPLLLARRGCPLLPPPPGFNALGLDVQPAVVERAGAWAAAAGLRSRVHFVRADAGADLGQLLGSYPGQLQLATVHFPDPGRQRERCVVQTPLVAALEALLAPRGHVLLQTEDAPTLEFMLDTLRPALAAGWLAPVAAEAGGEEARAANVADAGDGGGGAAPGWLLAANPLGVPSEREVYCESVGRGRDVLRVLLRRP